MTTPTQAAPTGSASAEAGSRSRLSSDAAALLSLLRDEASPDEPMTQLDAGHALGLSGSDDTVRRKVQKLCKEIKADTGTLVCASWGQPAGIFLPETREQERHYIARVLSRCYSTIGEYKGLDRERREEIAAEVQRRLELDGENGRERAVHESSDSKCDQCGGVFEPYRFWQRFCSDDCRMRWHGRKT